MIHKTNFSKKVPDLQRDPSHGGLCLGRTVLSVILSVTFASAAHASADHLESIQPLPVRAPGMWEIAPMPTMGQYDFVEFVGEQSWAFGYRNYAYWDGKAWTIYPLAEHTQGGVIGMKSLAVNDIWMVRLKAVFHWNGNEWQLADVPLDPTDELNDIDFVSPTLGWLVGAELDEKAGKSYGLVFHWDGQDWSRQKFNDIPGFTAIDMFSETDGWMVSFDGGVFRWNGSTWSHFDVPGIDELMNDFLYSASSGMRISMASATDGWLIGGKALWRWDGRQWREFQHARLDLNDIAMISPDSGWAVGGDWKTNDHLLLHWDGQQWTENLIVANSPLILVRANTSTGAWLLAYNEQTGEGPNTLYRYRSVPSPTTAPSPTETASITPTTAPLKTAIAAVVPATPTLFPTTVTPTGPVSRPTNTSSRQLIWLIGSSLLVIVAGGAAFILRRRRRV